MWKLAMAQVRTTFLDVKKITLNIAKMPFLLFFADLTKQEVKKILLKSPLMVKMG